MRKIPIYFLVAFCIILFMPALAYAGADSGASIITATGQDVPTDDHLEEDYRFPAEYRDNAVQFRTEDGVLLCGYVLGEGSRGVTLGHANGWMVKSWLPFAERLLDAGYMVIIWEFRNIEPSGFAPESESLRWDLDVLAAAQVLRERGAAEILAMGASDGGTATALAAPAIPELVGLGILSSPSDSKGDAVEAIGRIKDVPAFFAVSTNDSAGDLYPHAEALYEACASTQKQFNVIDGFDHGTDMIMPDVPGLGYASFPTDDEQIQKRQEVADKLFLFVSETFSGGADETGGDEMATPTPVPTGNETTVPSPTPESIETAAPVPEESNDSLENGGNSATRPALLIGVGVVLALVIVLCIIRARRRKR